jgi:DNA helicase-2/ATP-dependent DNA helicase PcrA
LNEVPRIATSVAASGSLAGLDPNQRAAAASVHGPLLIVAGPGSGKTRTLTHRIAHLVADEGAAPESCLAITFTRRAAAEMKERLTQLLPDCGERVAVHTFHSLGLAILREHANAAGLQRGFRVADDAERAGMLAPLVSLSERKARSLLQAISNGKRSQQPVAAELAEVAHAYRQAMSMRNWIDFDDLVGLALRLLNDEPGIAAHYRDRFRWISVDEFQDLDASQYALLGILAPAGSNLCAIGDPQQAIYGFRGADAAIFARFRNDYPDAAVISLNRNYRSSGMIVSASTQIIESAAGESHASEIVRDMLDHVTIHVAPTERAEAEFVVHSIEQLIGGHNFFSIDSGRTSGGVTANLSFSDFAVLYRTDAQSVALCEAFERSGMPYKKHSHDRLMDQPAVAALMRALEDLPVDESGGQSLESRLLTAATRLAEQDAGCDVAALQSTAAQLTTLAQSCGSNHGRFLEAAAQATEADLWDPRADRVSLLTMHASKGLEFPVLFVVGLEDGILPLRWGNGATAENLAEERRLFYVAMTRAEDRLFLTRAQKRLWRGEVRSLPPSPYLQDIQEELLRHSRFEAARRKAPPPQLELF